MVLPHSKNYSSKWQSELRSTTKIKVATRCHNISEKQEPPGSGVGGIRSPQSLNISIKLSSLPLHMPEPALI